VSPCKILKRTDPSVPKVKDLPIEIRAALSSLQLPVEKIDGKRIAISIGSRGISDLSQIVRSLCEWLRELGAQPFVFPAMGSHGGETAEGQRKVLEEYGVSADEVGAEIRAAMGTINLGADVEGGAFWRYVGHWQCKLRPHYALSGHVSRHRRGHWRHAGGGHVGASRVARAVFCAVHEP